MFLLTACARQKIALADNHPIATTSAAEQPEPTGGDPPRAEIIVAAAADLRFAFTEIARLFEEQSGHQVTLVFGSTGQLVQQIENGAPYDVIAAANVDYIRQLADQKLVFENSVALYARGRIVLAVNRRAGVLLTELEGLLDPKIQHIAIANPAHAPYGLAAQQALESAGIWEDVQPRLVYAENVRQALQYIQSGDAEAGIIALSVANVPEITWTLIDESLHQPLDQALAIVTSSSHQQLASQFIAFINGKNGRLIMRRYGFIFPGETPALYSTPTP